MDPAGTAWNHLADDDFPRDVTILTTNAQVVFEDGTRAEVSKGVYNHHLVFFNQDKSIPSVLSCDGQTARRGIPMSLFVGGSEDKGAQYFTTPDGKFNSGYYIGKKDRILMGGDVVNYTNKTQTVFAEVEVEYVDGKVAGLMETGQHSVSVGMCDGVAGTNLTAPKGQTKFTYTGKEITVFTDGYLVSAKGHLHGRSIFFVRNDVFQLTTADGGVDVTMKLNGKEICDSKAEYGGAASTLKDGDKVWKTINQMTYCDGPVKMVKGDKLLLEAKYDLDEHAPRIQHNGGMAEEMALFAAYFAVGP